MQCFILFKGCAEPNSTRFERLSISFLHDEANKKCFNLFNSISIIVPYKGLEYLWYNCLPHLL